MGAYNTGRNGNHLRKTGFGWKSAWFRAILGVFIVFLIVGGTTSCKKKRKTRKVRRVRKVVKKKSQQKKYKSKRYNELEGQSMAEWCKDQEKSNQALKDRKKRVGAVETGKKKRR